jgi:transposase-like protein
MSDLRHSSRPRCCRIFRPPHCPHRPCRFYRPQSGWKVVRDGFYQRPSDRRRFQRFRCRHCGRRFSTRTFAADYWLRRRDLLPQIAELASEGPGLRQMARLLHVTHATVGGQLSRAGRHCLLYHQEMVTGRPIREPLVIDGFETFEYSQYFPFHLNLAVGAESWFLYHFTDSPLRRKGAMTPAQRQRRERLESTLGRPDPKAVEVGVAALLRSLLPRWGDEPGHRDPSATSVLVLHSDDHPAYLRALRRLRGEGLGRSFRHQITPSTARRTTSNALFPCNLADLLLRHGQAGHRRETIAFSKRRQGALERLAVFTVWRNVVKRRREKQRGETAAMRAAILDRPLCWPEVLRARQFPRRQLLPGPWRSYYWRRVKTLALGERQTEHRRKHAF